MQEEQYDVGVLVGRFQEHELHEAHRDLIEYVCDRHDKVIVFLGISAVYGRNNPLDFQARKQMLLEAYPALNVLYIKDVGDDRLWSRRLDQQINTLITPSQSAVLYGGRESFISHYSGKYPVRELVQEKWMSATKIRDKIAKSATVATSDFRAGVIYGAYTHFPTSYQVIDAAVVDENHSRLLLGKRDYEPKYRFFGGFVDPTDPSLEATVRREIGEEAGIEICDPIYLGSTRIDDWRYRQEPDKILTAFFLAEYQFGHPTPGDDIDEVRWFDLNILTIDQVMPNHQSLFRILTNNLTQKPIKG